MYLQGTHYTIIANTIAGNTAVDTSSGVYAWVFGPPFVFTDNVVVAARAGSYHLLQCEHFIYTHFFLQ